MRYRALSYVAGGSRRADLACRGDDRGELRERLLYSYVRLHSLRVLSSHRVVNVYVLQHRADQVQHVSCQDYMRSSAAMQFDFWPTAFELQVGLVVMCTHMLPPC
jgi:hypothetical protein